jgi:Secretion system C-terminal sorting domain/Cleaved Adhesin Domain/Pregnancy-associated plasma protein-A
MKKITSKLLFLMLLSFATSITFAQDDISLRPNSKGFVRCATSLNERLLKAEHPERLSEDDFEKWLAPHIQKIKNDRAAGRSIQAVYNIPVVIHIIHNGDAIGAGENITDAQAISQITALNQDFRRMAGTRGGANTTGLAVDCEINFVLAQTSPTGTLTNGIDRRNIAPTTNAVAEISPGAGADWETRAAVETMKTTTSWDPTNYFNMWVIRVGGNTLATGGLNDLLGYAQFPSSSGLTGLVANGGNANTDGYVCRFDAFGTKDLDDGTFKLLAAYGLGRTSTHELGHCMGLKHIWGDNTACPASNTSADKDYCADTPAASAPNEGCDTAADTCPATAGLDMVQNYMDYTDDACMDTFTNDQKTRIQAVMAVSPRRNSLNTSTTGQTPTPLVRLLNSKATINEGTNCSFTDYNYPVELGKTPSQNATVTFTLTGTAVNNVDYIIVNPTLTFTPTSAPLSTQNLTIRVFNDGIAESAETIIVDLALNANGGNASINTASATFTMTINDNDVAPTPLTSTPIFAENADGVAPAATLQNFDGDAYNWQIVGSSLPAWGVTGNNFQSRSWIDTTIGGINPDNLLTFTTPIIIPTTGVTSLKFKSGSSYVDNTVLANSGEKYSVFLTPTIITTQAGANAATPILTRRDVGIMSATNSQRNIDVSSLAGQTVYLSFRHWDTFDKERLIIDDIEVSNSNTTVIQTAVNTATQYQASINANGSAFARDTTTNAVIADITSTTNFNYGCTTVAVSRSQASAGAAAVNYGSNTANNLKVMARTVTVTPVNANTSGAGNLKFYLTEAEIVAWETATGNARAALRVFKGGSSTSLPTTLGAFGPNVTLTGTIANGISGVYYFGVDAALGLGKNELANAVSVYPNPTKSVLNITISDDISRVNYTIYNSVGQEIKTVKVNSENDLKLNTSNFADGVYFIKIEKDGAFKTLQFVKN